MYWNDPQYLLLWWLVPGWALLLWYAHRRRRRVAARFAAERLLTRLWPRRDAWRSALKGTAICLAFASLVAGAARPRWGFHFEEVQARGVDAFILLDVSRSMLAEDVAPNRLAHAKSDIRDLLRQLEGDRVGLIVFAGASIVKVPLTTDHEFFQIVLGEINTNSAPRGGSLIGDAIRKAMESMEPRGDRDQVLVVITDGEDHDSFPKEAAREAARRGIKIFTVGLGDSAEGRRIPVRDESGQLTYLKHDGREVWSRMDEALLKEIALATGGAYVPARTTTYDLGKVYEDRLASLTRGQYTAERRKRYQDRFQWFVLLGVGLLLLETAIPRYPRQDVHERLQANNGGDRAAV